MRATSDAVHRISRPPTIAVTSQPTSGRASASTREGRFTVASARTLCQRSAPFHSGSNFHRSPVSIASTLM